MPNRLHLSLFALAGAFLGTQVAVHAQTLPVGLPPITAPIGLPNAPGAANRRAHPLTRALRALNLSTQQREQIRSIRQSYRASRSTASPETRAQMLAQVRSVLTPHQLQRFRVLMNRRNRVNGGANSGFNNGVNRRAAAQADTESPTESTTDTNPAN